MPFTFKDLEFGFHKSAGFCDRAKMQFDNGYGVSVVTGEYAYTDDEHPYELAVMHNGSITYESGITDDVIGYLTDEDVSQVMLSVQELPSKPSVIK